MWKDFKYGVRMLRAKPAFTVTAVLSLALGIGACTAIFSLVEAVLLRPLPYAEPDRIVVVASLKTAASPAESNKPGMNAPADFVAWKRQSQSLQALAALTGGPVNLERNNQVETLPGALVSEDYFAAFGVAPQLGRACCPDWREPWRPRAY